MAVGCTVPVAEPHRTLRCPDAVISPGFINLHDHLAYDAAPPLVVRETYARRHQWRKGQDGHTMLVAVPTQDPAVLAWIELRQAASGTTAVAGGAGSPGLIRNLDTDPPDPALGGRRVVSHTFPLGDAGGEAAGPACAYPAEDKPSVLKNRGYIAHVAEGVDSTAHAELQCLLGAPGGVDLRSDHTAFIHVVAEDVTDLAKMAERGTSVVWSPRSNLALYGHTSRITLMRTLGINVALGSDWALTGSATLQRELACAADYGELWLGGLSSETLWQMVTGNAARASGTADLLGRLEVGHAADLAIFARDPGQDPWQAAVRAETDDVVLVLRGGAPIWGDQGVVQGLSPTCELWPEPVCGRSRAACLDGTTVAALRAANAQSTPLYTCGPPTPEPACRPLGEIVPMDRDGDGALDPMDNCPSVWNRPRPMDGGRQADADDDGQGDVCDPRPLAR